MQNYRLPKNIYPTFYRLNITTNLSDFTFEGNVCIDTTFVNSTNICTINSKQLTIKSVKVDKTSVRFEEDTYDEIIKLYHDFTTGDHQIIIEYKGVLTDSMDGYYRSKYGDKYLAVTQFESTSARQAFPCFDEPNFKAKFQLTMTSKKEYVFLSNTSPIFTLIDNDYKTIKFAETPIMSTYLLAFIVGDLEYITDKGIETGQEIRIYGVPNNKHKMSFALDVTQKGLNYFNSWFNIKYPLNKLDLVAIPDFSAGAMENWGLITFRESDLYCDDNTDDREKHQNAITTIHELAHQWFGNLVTMEWWTYLWLNESMATYFGWHVADKLFPEWKLASKFVDDEYVNALELDSLESSHPIEVPIKRAADVQSIFDAISYSKGSCIVRFLVNYLGDDKFQQGMQKYMETNKYKNTTSDDLWDAFGSDVKVLMNSWTKQTGFPVISVTKSGDDIILSQQRFLKNSDSNNRNNDTLWMIPLDIQNDSGDVTRITLNDKTTTVKINSNNIIVNPKRTIFCRIQYVNIEPNLQNDYDNLTYLLDDSFALAMSGYHSFDKPFDIINKINLKDIVQYNFWDMLTRHVNTINDIFDKKSEQNKIKLITDRMCDSLSKIYKRTDITYELHELALKTLANYGNQDVIKWGLHKFNKFKQNSSIKYKYAIMKIAGMYGSNDDYNKMIELYRNSNDAQLRDVLLYGISNANNNYNLELIFSQLIRRQDIWIFVRQLMINEHMRNQTREFIYNNWNKFVEIYPMGTSEILTMIKAIGIGSKTDKELIQFKTFFDKHKIDGTDIAIAQTIEKIEANIALLKKVDFTT